MEKISKEGKTPQRLINQQEWYMLYAVILLNMKGILPQNNTAGLFVKEEAINIDTELDYR